MVLLQEEEESQRVLISAAMTASDIPCQDAWLRYVEFTGIADTYAISAYLAGVMSLPEVECNLLAHAVNELIDEHPLPPRAPHRGTTIWPAPTASTSSSTGNGQNDRSDELLRQWLFSATTDDPDECWHP